MELIDIYGKLPIVFQNMACFVEGTKIKHTRYNKEFLLVLEDYIKREKWKYEQIEEYRDKCLQNMILYAYENTVYYKKLMKDGGIDPKTIKTVGDLKKIPVLTKKIINTHLKELIVEGFDKRKIIHSHTSGTTGTALRFYNTTDTIHNQWAAFWRTRIMLGIKFDLWCGIFGSRIVVPFEQKKAPYWRYNPPCKQIYFSAFHESDDNLIFYYRELKKRKIKWIHGYPSLITPLASFIVKNKLEPLYDIKFVTTGAENLYSYQREIIKLAFGVEPYDVYGQSENVVIITERKNRKMVVEEDFSAVEFSENNSGQFRMIGTSLYNYVMPLIRYDTKDIVSNVKIDGEVSRKIVESIDGRYEDYIFLPDGRKIGKLDHVFKDTVNFSAAQIYQKKDYSILIYVVRAGENWEEDQKTATNILRKSIGKSLDIKFEYVAQIPKTKGGKMPFVISEIKE